jgi:hypothetical protein
MAAQRIPYMGIVNNGISANSHDDATNDTARCSVGWIDHSTEYGKFLACLLLICVPNTGLQAMGMRSARVSGD